MEETRGAGVGVASLLSAAGILTDHIKQLLAHLVTALPELHCYDGHLAEEVTDQHTLVHATAVR